MTSKEVILCSRRLSIFFQGIDLHVAHKSSVESNTLGASITTVTVGAIIAHAMGRDYE